MKIRALASSDLETVKEIHDRYYSHEFDLPDFSTGFYGAFAVINDAEQIVAVGGVRPIAEAVVLTDKKYTTHERVKALKEVLTFSMLLCNEAHFTELHAFVQDQEWLNHLNKIGFESTKGLAVILKF